MKPAVPNYILQNCIRVEADCKRGIPHLIELHEQLDTVSVKLGAMPISTARSLRHKKSKARLGAQKAFVVGGMEVDAGESINNEQSSEASSDESDMEDTTIIMHHLQQPTPGNPLTVTDGENSVILSMLKTNGKTRPACASTIIGLFDGSSRSFNGKRDRSLSPIKKTGSYAYIDNDLDKKPTQSDTNNSSHASIDPCRKEWRKISIMNKIVAKDPEITSQYLDTDIESPDDGTLVDASVCGIEHIEGDTPARGNRSPEAFSGLQLSPSTSIMFESSEQILNDEIFDEGNTVIHNMPAVKFDMHSLYTQKQVHTQHRRNISTTSFMNNSTKISIPLRARSRTNDGMLELKTGISAANTPKKLAHQHRRKISMNLPINIQSSQQFIFPPTVPVPPIIPVTLPSVSGLDERELEYKHRHTFIGTASLDDFLEILELSPDHTVTRPKVAKTFVILASTEQLLARQSSAYGTGWELVSRITPDLASGHTNYLAQAHIKLGSVTLRQFLELIPFDEKDIINAMGVIEAFYAASHMDRTAGSGVGSKAKAFRSWMLSK